jgi:hypothetical protein
MARFVCALAIIRVDDVTIRTFVVFSPGIDRGMAANHLALPFAVFRGRRF